MERGACCRHPRMRMRHMRAVRTKGSATRPSQQRRREQQPRGECSASRATAKDGMHATPGRALAAAPQWRFSPHSWQKLKPPGISSLHLEIQGVENWRTILCSNPRCYSGTPPDARCGSRPHRSVRGPLSALPVLEVAAMKHVAIAQLEVARLELEPEAREG